MNHHTHEYEFETDGNDGQCVICGYHSGLSFQEWLES